MTRLATHLGALVLCALLALCGSLPAMAHAQLLATSPAANTVLDSVPTTATLTFNEPVTALAITLIGADGDPRDLLAATESGETLVVTLPAEMSQGTHALSWRVVSVDAHPIAGTLIFSVGTASAAPLAETAASSRATTISLWLGKTGLFIALVIGVGGAVFALAAPLPVPARRAAIAASAVGLVLAPLTLGLHGADAMGLAPDALIGTTSWATGFLTSYGTSVLLLLGAFALALAALLLPSLGVLAWLAWALSAIALAVSGHAGAAQPQMLTRAAVIFHIGGILFWTGALLPLWFALSSRGETADRALIRFSRFIPFAVLPLLVSGIVLAVIQLGAPGPAWLTPYGYILAAKLALLVLLLALALWNRLSLTAPALKGELKARHRLRFSIRLELVLVLLILALAAGWRFTPPPRALAEVEAAQAARAALLEPIHAHAMDDKIMAGLTITPGTAGPVRIEIEVTDIDYEPIEPVAVDITFSAPERGIEPFKASATLLDGLWVIEGQTIPLSGLWELILDIRVDRFTLARMATEIDIP